MALTRIVPELVPGLAPKQSNQVDTTEGAGLTVGAFGLGALDLNAAGLTWPNASLDDVTGMGSGTYRFSFAGAEGPLASNNWGVVWFARRTSAQLYQVATIEHRSWSRYSYDSGATWTNWAMIYTRHTVVGPVSHNLGIPTGAIIERGSNANGEYVKFADGTMICSREIVYTPVSGNRSIDINITFPSVFITTPRTSVSSASNYGNAYVVAQGVSVVASGMTARAMNPDGTTHTPSTSLLHVLAFGRWF